jgi:phenylpropionate dioxygenase-like ring-hydroxylating dioxygenase large terminal subunit
MRLEGLNQNRHRAFEVVNAAYGTVRIFSCQYHGWSYDLNGKLTKAPRFLQDTVNNFEKSGYGLFPVHTHIDRNGFVYIPSILAGNLNTECLIDRKCFCLVG